MEAIDGPAKGLQTVDRLNLHNKNETAVRIANQQLAAYCHVTGVYAFNATEELHGKPFVVEMVARRDNPNQTEVGKLFDMNGNEPGKAGSGAPTGATGRRQRSAAPGRCRRPADSLQAVPGQPAADSRIGLAALGRWRRAGGGGAQPTGGGWQQGGGRRRRALGAEVIDTGGGFGPRLYRAGGIHVRLDVSNRTRTARFDDR
jgi:hypothetical protein